MIIRYFMNIKWNWGAFLLCPIWSIAHHVWLGMISFISMGVMTLITLMSVQPIVGMIITIIGRQRIFIALTFLYFLTSILMGLKGTKLATSKSTYLTQKEFDAKQRIWTIAGFTLFIPVNFFFLYTTYAMIEASTSLYR
jgi:hypothetical protein